MNESQTFGPYTVLRTVRFDNPAFPQFTVMRGGKIVGRSLSALDRGWCEFVERMANGERYVENPAREAGYSYAFTEERKRAGRRGRAARIASRKTAAL